MESNRVWFYLCLMIGIPFLIPMIIPDPYATFAIIGSSMGMLFMIRKFAKGIATGLLKTKMIWICASCQKQHNKVECPRCGSRQRKML